MATHKSNGRILTLVMKAAFLAPLFAAYGAWRIVIGTVFIVRRVIWTVRLSRPFLICGSCGERNLLHGRWVCTACNSTYHGFVARCPCGAGAAIFSCRRCGVSLPLGPRR